MAITTRDELVRVLASIGIMGMAREGDLDILFAAVSTPPTVDTLTGATATGKAVMKATDATAARTAIGAGTSSVVVGTGATNAKAGNYVPTSAEVAAGLKAKAQIAALTNAAAGADAAALVTAVNAIIAALKA